MKKPRLVAGCFVRWRFGGCRCPESNWGPSVTWGGFEPPVFSLGVRCSIQLSYQVIYVMRYIQTIMRSIIGARYKRKRASSYPSELHRHRYILRQTWRVKYAHGERV